MHDGFQTSDYPRKVWKMNPRPLYFKPGKKISNNQFFRNYWCSNYDRCLDLAAREDLFMDCAQCFHKDSVMERFTVFFKDSRAE